MQHVDQMSLNVAQETVSQFPSSVMVLVMIVKGMRMKVKICANLRVRTYNSKTFDFSKHMVVFTL